MTRKKFVKQLMALGYQRNSAEGIAKYARIGGWTYEQYLKIEREYNGAHARMIAAARKIADAVMPALNDLAAIAEKAKVRISEALSSITLEVHGGGGND